MLVFNISIVILQDIRSILRLGNVIRGLNLNKNPSAEIEFETSQINFSAQMESLIKVSVWKISRNVSIFLSLNFGWKNLN